MNSEMFSAEQQDVFWIVGTGRTVRHATTSRPGAVYAGQLIHTLCEDRLTVPQPTPLGREPATKVVTGKCAECERKAQECDFTATIWDF